MREISDFCNGRYQTLTFLGEGGTAEVWRVLDTRLQVERALKVMMPPPNEEARVRQQREAQVMAALDHPNVVVVHDTFEEDGCQILVMEKCEESAAQRVARDGVIEADEVVRIALAMLSALTRAHEAGVVHRDIKPHNILFSKSDVPKLADFGLAWVRDTPDAITRTGAVMGSIAFMSPEQRRGEPATAATDLYCLAATLYFLLTGELPCDLYVTSNWEKVSGVIPEHLLRVLVRAGRLHPSERFVSAEAMEQALRGRRFADSTERLEPEFVVRPRVSRLRFILAFGAAALLGVLLFVQVKASIGGPLGDTLEPEVTAIHQFLSMPKCDEFGNESMLFRYPDRSSQAPGLREASVATFYDIDRDGYLDYAVGHILDETVRIFWGDGTGEIKDDFTDVATMRNFGLAFGDIDADGLTDFVVTNPRTGTLGLAFGTGPRTFGEFVVSDEDMSVHMVAISDWNGDGVDEVLLNSTLTNREVLSRSHDEAMGLAPFDIIYTGLFSMAVGDVDGDGAVELVGINEERQLVIVKREQSGLVETVVPRPHARGIPEPSQGEYLTVVEGMGVFIGGKPQFGEAEFYRMKHGEFVGCRGGIVNNTRVVAVGDINGDEILDMGQVGTAGYSTSQYFVRLGQ
jgi:serine/threonine protein kinase